MNALVRRGRFEVTSGAGDVDRSTALVSSTSGSPARRPGAPGVTSRPARAGPPVPRVLVDEALVLARRLTVDTPDVRDER